MHNNQQIVVSLTSFPAAISYAEKAIESILRGSVLPDKIVLYLTLSEFGDAGVPESMRKLQASNPIFEIRNFSPDIRSYQKLIPALRDFPESVIVTIDDDIDYHPDMLRDLLRIHREVPNAIVAHRARRIIKDKPYKQWKKYHWRDFLFHRIHKDYTTIQTGVGGVLYPPHCLCEEMLQPELFSSIAPTADDIWFWAAAVRKGTPIVPVPFGKNHPREIGKPNTLALKRINYTAGEDRNAAIFKRILEKYPDLENLFK